MSDAPQKLVVDCKTGKQAYVPLSADEIAQREADAIKAEAERVAEEQAQAELEANKQSAKDKLASLGLTEAEVIALLGN